MEVVIEKMEETQIIRLLLVLAADISLIVEIFTNYDKIFLPDYIGENNEKKNSRRKYETKYRNIYRIFAEIFSVFYVVFGHWLVL